MKFHPFFWGGLIFTLPTKVGHDYLEQNLTLRFLAAVLRRELPDDFFSNEESRHCFGLKSKQAVFSVKLKFFYRILFNWMVDWRVRVVGS